MLEKCNSNHRMPKTESTVNSEWNWWYDRTAIHRNSTNFEWELRHLAAMLFRSVVTLYLHSNLARTNIWGKHIDQSTTERAAYWAELGWNARERNSSVFECLNYKNILTESLDIWIFSIGLANWMVFSSVKSSNDQRQTVASALELTNTSLTWLTCKPLTAPRWWSIFVIYSHWNHNTNTHERASARTHTDQFPTRIKKPNGNPF